MAPPPIAHVLKCPGPAEQTVMCDDTFQCLWETLVFLFLLAAPPLRLFWLWFRVSHEMPPAIYFQANHSPR
jgi:hypothetical protein